MTTSAVLDRELVEELRDIMAEGFVTLVESYERDTQARLAGMQVALREGDRMVLRQMAHSLKGSSSNLGALEVTGYCVQLEQIATQGSESQLGELITAIDAAHQQALSELKVLCDTP
jgi:histidine phosphotransfer protein HptB